MLNAWFGGHISDSVHLYEGSAQGTIMRFALRISDSNWLSFGNWIQGDILLIQRFLSAMSLSCNRRLKYISFFDMGVGRGSRLGMIRLTTINIMQPIGIKMGDWLGIISDQIKREHNA